MIERITATAASILAVMTLSACGQAARTGAGTPSPTPPGTANSTPGWTTTNVPGTDSPVSISHPIAWKFVTSEPVSLGKSAIVGYFTNAPTVKQCHTKNVKGGGQIDCNGPVARLNAGQVLITVTAEYQVVTDGRVKTNTLVDRHPAIISPIGDPQFLCPPGVGRAQELDVDLPDTAPANPKSHWHLLITACIGDNGAGPSQAATTASVEKLLRSVTFPSAAHG